MDVDPNYDPSDFLAMHKPRQNLGEPTSLQVAFSDFMPNAQDDNEASTSAAAAAAASGVGMGLTSVDDDSAAMQMPTEMGTGSMNNGRGIDDDLDISESDEEDDGTRVRIKKELFDDGDYAAHHHQQQQMGGQLSQSQVYLVDSSNEPTAVDYQQASQLDFQQAQGIEQMQMQQQVMPPLQPDQIQQQPQTPQGDNDYAWTF